MSKKGKVFLLCYYSFVFSSSHITYCVRRRKTLAIMVESWCKYVNI